MREPTDGKIWRATFRNFKLASPTGIRILAGDFEMELRPLRTAPHLFHIAYVSHGRPLSSRRYTLLGAQEKLRLLFQAQMTEWTEVKTHAGN